MMWGYGGGFGSGYGLFGGFFMIIWWVIIIAVIVSLVRWFAAPGCGHGGSCGHGHGHGEGHGAEKDSAMEILKERYARGEIGKEEFEEKKDAIS